MGCDIHLYAEVQNTKGEWESIGDEDIYDGRNYNLFAILANVRNGRGFAGSDTGDGFVPIVEPRGVPDDASEEFKDKVESWGCDGHSHSYLTLKELMEYDWTQEAILRGIVSEAEYMRWKLDKSPDSWCSSVGGGGVQIISNEEMERNIIANHGPITWPTLHKVKQAEGQFGNLMYTKVQWTRKYYECCSEFLGKTLPQLWTLNKDFSKTRIVFFFDN